MIARRHHFISQFYLAGFTKAWTKKSSFYCFDLLNKRSFKLTPKQVGLKRDFNRVDIKGQDQNVLENELAQFEAKAKNALDQLHEDLDFSGEVKEIIISFMALLAVRSDQRRKHLEDPMKRTAEIIMDMATSSKEQWDYHNDKLKEDNSINYSDVSYEDAKKFKNNKNYKITIAREKMIDIEFKLVETLVPLLSARGWTLVDSNDLDEVFITSDDPINLYFTNGLTNPGFGLKDTQIYFPLSKNLALIGDFDLKDKTIKCTREHLAFLNSIVIEHASKQIYATKERFLFSYKEKKILNGKMLFDIL